MKDTPIGHVRHNQYIIMIMTPFTIDSVNESYLYICKW